MSSQVPHVTDPPIPSVGGKRVAIVTGGSQGIGAGVVAAFRHAGYAVVATARSIAKADESDFITVEGDITQAETAERVVEQAVERFGRVDSLINDAGVYIGKPFTDYTIEDYSSITDVNLTGFFYITQRVIRQMVVQGTGHIVNISTSLVDQPDSTRPGALASLTKGGLAAVARSLAIEYASRRGTGQRSLAGSHQDPHLRPGVLRGHGLSSPPGPGG